MFVMYRYLVLLLWLFCLAFGLDASQKEYGTLRVSRVVSVYDRDTFRADLVGVSDIIGKNIGIRINGIDTPEINNKNIQ